MEVPSQLSGRDAPTGFDAVSQFLINEMLYANVLNAVCDTPNQQITMNYCKRHRGAQAAIEALSTGEGSLLDLFQSIDDTPWSADEYLNWTAQWSNIVQRLGDAELWHFDIY